MPTPYELLGARTDRSRPFVTGYDGPDTCTELSVVTTMNAVAKAAGFLRDELGLGPGDRLSVDLPVHWQLPVWTLAGLTAGLVVVLRATDTVEARLLGPAGLAALAEGTAAWADEVLGCSCDAFGMPVRPPVPAGVIDVGLAVRAHPDVFRPDPAAVGRAALLLPGAGGEPSPLAWSQLLGAGGADEPGARTWVTEEDLRDAGLPAALLLRRAATDPVLRGGSVVLARGLTPQQAARLRAEQGARVDLAAGPEGSRS